MSRYIYLGTDGVQVLVVDMQKVLPRLEKQGVVSSMCTEDLLEMQPVQAYTREAKKAGELISAQRLKRYYTKGGKPTLVVVCRQGTKYLVWDSKLNTIKVVEKAEIIKRLKAGVIGSNITVTNQGNVTSLRALSPILTLKEGKNPVKAKVTEGKPVKPKVNKGEPVTSGLESNILRCVCKDYARQKAWVFKFLKKGNTYGLCDQLKWEEDRMGVDIQIETQGGVLRSQGVYLVSTLQKHSLKGNTEMVIFAATPYTKGLKLNSKVYAEVLARTKEKRT